MNLKTIFGTAAIGLALPVAASAATLTVTDLTNGEVDADAISFGSGDDFPLIVVDGDNNATQYDVDIDFSSDAGSLDGFTGETGPLSFSLLNESDDFASITVSTGTIRQQDEPRYGFTGGVGEWFEDGVDAVGGIVAYLLANDGSTVLDSATFDFGEQIVTGFSFSTTIASGQEATLVFDFDNVRCDVDSCPEIDFTVTPTPVPVPAAGFLLLGGLGGLAMLRRRKKS